MVVRVMCIGTERDVHTCRVNLKRAEYKIKIVLKLDFEKQCYYLHSNSYLR